MPSHRPHRAAITHHALTAAILAGATALAGCATEPELKLAPAASSGVGVRFSRGEAVMISAGAEGAIAIRPLRYNGDTKRVLLVVAGYNRAGQPINFGPENLSISLDSGATLPVYDFDTLRHQAKADADRERTLAFMEAALDSYAAYRVGRHHPAEGRAMMQDAADRYDDQLHSIGDNLVRRINGARAVLETTTIDPGTYWAGGVMADQPPLAEGEVRKMTVNVTFGGETHHFSLFLAAEGTPTPPQVNLPAVTRADAETTLYQTPQTWLWNAPPPPPQPAQTTWSLSRF